MDESRSKKIRQPEPLEIRVGKFGIRIEPTKFSYEVEDTTILVTTNHTGTGGHWTGIRVDNDEQLSMLSKAIRQYKRSKRNASKIQNSNLDKVKKRPQVKS